MTARAFELALGANGLATLTFDLPERRANLFTRATFAELESTVAALAARDDVAALVLRSAKPDIFIAGADVEEIAAVTDPAAAEAGARLGQRLFDAWEALPFPTVAAIRGACLGGGTELALASTWIAISDRPELRLGLPEVRLGILPGWGGCTRLPRRIGLIAALDLILSGRTIDGRRAGALGLADVVLPDAAFDRHVHEFTLARLGRRRRPRRPHGLRGLLLEANPLGRGLVLARARRATLRRTRGRYPAPLAALDVVATGLWRGRSAGFAAEAVAIGTLAVSPVAKNLIHLFRLAEATKRSPGDGREPARVRRPAVVGAGVMGGGIAHLIVARTELPVRLQDVQAAALGGALRHAADLLVRGRHGRDVGARQRRLARIQPTLGLAGLAGCDFVIEAAVERLEVKQEIFEALDAALAPDAVLASNTSSLSIDAIAARTARPGRVVGMHFFNPVHRMPLVEIVEGPRTDPASTRATAAFARRLGKTPIVVRECPGFLVNRLLMFYAAEALWLLDEGHRIEDVDRAMVEWGMPMGPMRLADEVGLDVAAKVGHLLQDAFGERLRFPSWLDRLPAAGRLGLKNGRGIYRYRGRRALGVDAAVYREARLDPERRPTALAPLAERMVLPMVNEAARCLDEGVVAGPGPLDLALVLGIGMPPFRGGLCRWADARGLPELIAALERLAAEVDGRLAPAEALRRYARAGGFYAAAGS